MNTFRIQERLVQKRTASEFLARYKGHEIYIQRENQCFKPFYIMVTAPSGSYCYDGWWGESWNTMEDAIAQALKGSCLNEKTSRTAN